jgi:hypothetical protein
MTPSPSSQEGARELKAAPDVIYLEPDCAFEERCWCDTDQGPCDECGLPWVKYVRADARPTPDRTDDVGEMVETLELRNLAREVELEACMERIEALQRDRDALREALKPFAHYAALNDLLDSKDPERAIEVPVRDLLAAYALLHPENEE